MRELVTRQKYQEVYGPFGTIIPSPMVNEVLENKHGIYNPVIDVITDRNESSGTNGIIEPTNGAINNTNVIFAFDEKPEVVIVNGNTYRENRGWSWDGSNVTLDDPPGVGGDVFGIGVDTELSIFVPSGTVDNSNTTFVFVEAPTLIVINGKTLRSGHGWSGSLTVTTDDPVGNGGDIFSIL
jgi:hypothetical protein